MDDTMKFICAVILTVLIWGGYKLKEVDYKEYFKTDTGKDILKGIVLAIAFALIFAIFSKSAEARTGWFNNAEVYAGLDYTKKINPVCVGGSIDDRSGSNIGLKLNVYRDDRFSTNWKYTHHSCAFGQDSRSYDALGIELKYKFWSR